MASDLGRETKDALLKAIKEQASGISKASVSTSVGAEALKHLAEAYALLERPKSGSGR